LTENEEDREELVSAIIDGMIAEMTYEELRNHVWDSFYDDLIWQEWADIQMYAERYASTIAEKFG
jgi:hypothetical protein